MCRDVFTTVGATVELAHGGLEFLEGFLRGIVKFAIFRMENNRFGRIHINHKFIRQRSKEFFSDGLEKVEIKRS